jgi:hypothetical protein
VFTTLLVLTIGRFCRLQDHPDRNPFPLAPLDGRGNRLALQRIILAAPGEIGSGQPHGRRSKLRRAVPKALNSIRVHSIPFIRSRIIELEHHAVRIGHEDLPKFTARNLNGPEGNTNRREVLLHGGKSAAGKGNMMHRA